MFKFRDYGLNNHLETYYETDEPTEEQKRIQE